MAVFAREIEVGTGIEAPPERVWEVLTDFGRYPEWNPFITSIEGPVGRRARLRVQMQPPGGRRMEFRPRLREAEPPHLLHWLGRVGLPWVFDGSHRFEVEELAGGGVHFIQRERFAGVLVPFMRRTIRRTEQGFAQMNQALARRVADGTGSVSAPPPTPPGRKAPGSD